MAQVSVLSLGGIGAPCCCRGPCVTNICVGGCGNSILAGLTIEIKIGSTVVASGTTITSACLGLIIPSAGTYDVVVTGPGFPTNTSSHLLTCGGTINIGLGSPPSGMVCCGLCPTPQTLTLTDSLSSCTLTYDATAFKWLGSYTFSAPTITLVNSLGFNCACTFNASGTSRVCYQFDCGTLTMFWLITDATAGAFNCSPPGGFTLLDIANDMAGNCSAGLGGSICPSYLGVANAVQQSSPITAPTACIPFTWSTSSLGGGTINPTSGSVTITA